MDNTNPTPTADTSAETQSPVNQSDPTAAASNSKSATGKWIIIGCTAIALIAGAILGGGAVYYYLSANDSSDATDMDGMYHTPTTTPTTTPTPTATPTPTINLLEQYPTVNSTSTSPDGQWNLSLRTKTGSNRQAVIVSKVDGSSAKLITQDPGDGHINSVSNTNWSPDGTYVYLTVDKNQTIPVWLLRLDGQTIGNYGTSILMSDGDDFSGIAMVKGSVVEPTWQGNVLKAGNIFSWDAQTGQIDVDAVGN